MGQSTFNVAFLANNRVDPFLFDARLTEIGEGQASALADNAEIHLQNIQVVITTPMTRALDTTRRGLSKLIKNKGINCVVCPLHRETLTTSDDNGRPISIVKTEFPEFDFSTIEERWWYLPEEIKSDFTIDHEEYFKKSPFKEPEEVIAKRVQDFKEYLLSRPESHIAVVGHCDFFYHLLDKKHPHMKNCQIIKFMIETGEVTYLT
ncbi:hypothetical protein DICPUDRAFT_157828 [Dictyostelium purpureum]|uniref:Phosphoglycerate mutase family protein n=1 Tax=Dictyostelium purpureum TaxID=5786 RepID=F1A037_DICPU|nr:uncharacterized protein DICPUDRAFT_157828 [Dictyostelium purpureum]EGC30452.1 hypothetical protein DICPUDRAFT_157828 [Dictyostelium purpureum]|eukprot:XP_003293031.1 hypothetical protein DICPUDRAFT_157828 [Dictyostelium purpureum]